MLTSNPLFFRSLTMRIEAPTPSLYRLIFKTPPSTPIFTGSKIEDSEGKPLQILLVGGPTDSPSYCPKPIKVELVVLDGDFPLDGTDDWTSEEFNKYVVKERAGKRPLLTGEVSNITMRDGEVTIGELQFTDNSSWIRSRNFRIAVRVVPGSYEGPRIREAITDKFVVRDHRGERK
jgi:Calmodulin binding protein-like